MPSPTRTDWQKRLEGWLAKAERTPSGCLIWPGYIDSNGYGKFRWNGVDGSKRQKTNAHRVVWIAAHGEPPPGTDIDHVKARGCTSRACVELAHLEAVTHRENVRRGESPSGSNADKTECKRGHPLSGENLYMNPRTGKRKCRACAAKEQRDRREERTRAEAQR